MRLSSPRARIALAVVIAALATWTATCSSRKRPIDRATTPSSSRTPAKPSPGCGLASTLPAGQFVAQQLRVAGQARSYQLRLPDAYDPARPYALIFRFHGYSGDGLSGGLEIERNAGAAAIVVGPDGLDQGWSRSNEANDLALFDAIFELLSKHHCVDLGRVYVYGFSMGGGFANLLSCVRADKLRASAAVAAVERGKAHCPSALAAWFTHDRQDPIVPFSAGEQARDRARARNHCGTRTERLSDGCLRYEDCDPGAPVIWCETEDLGHSIDSHNAPERVWIFFAACPEHASHAFEGYLAGLGGGTPCAAVYTRVSSSRE